MPTILIVVIIKLFRIMKYTTIKVFVKMASCFRSQFTQQIYFLYNYENTFN